jgi:hypothetical protein
MPECREEALLAHVTSRTPSVLRFDDRVDDGVIGRLNTRALTLGRSREMNIQRWLKRAEKN